MSPKKKSPGTRSQAAAIIKVLADKLPDDILQGYFTDLSPGQVREILLKAKMFINSPSQAKLSPSVPKAPKAMNKGADWQGKLKGATLNLYTDGASRGNPGEAGAGMALFDDQGNELIGTGKYLGRCTNNEAEYRALLLGLAKCSDFGSGRIKAHLDSELIVKQVRGQYKVKHPNLKPLFQEAMQKLSTFASYSITHVPRKENSRADELANEAIDQKL